MSTEILTAGIDSQATWFLAQGGYSVATAPDTQPHHLCELLQQHPYQSVLFGMDARIGIETISSIRDTGFKAPIIRIMEGPWDEAWADRCARFLDAGCDNVLLGPTNLRLIELAIRQTLWRTTSLGPRILRFEKDGQVLEIDELAYKVWVNGKMIALTGRQINALVILANRLEIVSNSYLHEHLMLHGKQGYWGIVDLIRRLRDALGDARVLLQTHYDLGYELLGRVS
ncbi:MAG: hypothetical protein V4480_01955 [Patescibacteria group bacterium]